MWDNSYIVFHIFNPAGIALTAFFSSFQPELLAAHRDYLQKFNLIELSQELTGKRTHLTLFLFSDCIEVNLSN